MDKTERDPLIDHAGLSTSSGSDALRGAAARGSSSPPPFPPPNGSDMHHPQHHYFDPDDGGVAAVATRSPSRQLFYRDRIPSQSTLTSESRDYGAPVDRLAARTLPGGPGVSPGGAGGGGASAASVVLPPGPTASSDSDDSSVPPYGDAGGMGRGGIRGGGTMGGRGGLRPPSSSSHPHALPPPHRPLHAHGVPPPRQLHADYSHRLHRNQVEQGRNNFVVGGAHGRYRDYGGTLIEVPEEVYAVRKAALTVLDPITYCWLILTVGFSISVAMGAAKWTSKMDALPYWAIFAPTWAAHVGVFFLHISSARALSKFISEANENRQRQDSTDHLDRVEYLPLLQRSLKFGLKTGVLCFVVFAFEVLLFMRLWRPGSITLAETFIPLWILAIVYLGNGIVCKSQHFLHSVIWALGVTAMIFSVLRTDYGMVDTITTGHIVIVLVAMLSTISGILIYIVHGHQIGYYKLTESQLTAGVFYSTSSFLAILLVAIMGDFVALPELIQLDLLLVIVILAPIVVALAGFGAYLVTRDEFDRLLKYGGQSAVMPMRLRLETNGWTSVVCRGAVTIPMFGDVRYEPLDAETAERLSIELCGPCCCYPAEEEDEMPYFHRDNYQSPTPPNSQMAVQARWGGSEAPIV
ncbi:hypothetical protein ACHAWF_010233 [Thalassiosira exigua]